MAASHSIGIVYRQFLSVAILASARAPFRAWPERYAHEHPDRRRIEGDIMQCGPAEAGTGELRPGETVDDWTIIA